MLSAPLFDTRAEITARRRDNLSEVLRAKAVLRATNSAKRRKDDPAFKAWSVQKTNKYRSTTKLSPRHHVRWSLWEKIFITDSGLSARNAGAILFRSSVSVDRMRKRIREGRTPVTEEQRNLYRQGKLGLTDEGLPSRGTNAKR